MRLLSMTYKKINFFDFFFKLLIIRGVKHGIVKILVKIQVFSRILILLD